MEFKIVWRGVGSHVHTERPTTELEARERYDKLCRDVQNVKAVRFTYKVPHGPMNLVAEYGTRFYPLD